MKDSDPLYTNYDYNNNCKAFYKINCTHLNKIHVISNKEVDLSNFFNSVTHPNNTKQLNNTIDYYLQSITSVRQTLAN